MVKKPNQRNVEDDESVEVMGSEGQNLVEDKLGGLNQRQSKSANNARSQTRRN